MYPWRVRDVCVERGCMQRIWCLEEDRRKIGVGNMYREKENARNMGRSLVEELSSETRGLKGYMAVGKKESLWWKGQHCTVEFGSL